jgi:transketolase
MLLRFVDGRPVSPVTCAFLAWAADRLAAEGVRARVVSMPSWELFERQPRSYRDEVLPPSARTRLSVEAAASFGWERWVGEEGASLALDHFGASAPGARVMAELGFSADNVAARARSLLQSARKVPEERTAK